MATMIQKLLRQQKQAEISEKTLPLSDNQPAQPKTVEAAHNLDWNFSAAQDVGMHRDHNEDALFTLGSHLAHQEKYLFTGLFIIADGMGGHANGELASSLAIRTMADLLIGAIIKMSIVEQEATDDDVKELLTNCLEEANRQVKKQVPGGGTTLTTAFIYQNQLHVAHVGDSRVYLIQPDNQVQVLTRDHSLVKQLVEIGQLTEAEAAVHPQRNILSMALGQWEPLAPDYIVQSLPASGFILLCSDGLWGVVPEKKIAQIVLTSSDPQKACHKLIETANQAGGPDNISVIVISIPK